MSFLEREVRAGDRVAIVVVGSGAWWTATIPDGREDLGAFLAGQSAGRSARADGEMTDHEAQRIAEYDDSAVREDVVDRWVRQGKCEDMCQYMSPCDPRDGRRACSEQVRDEALRRDETARHGLLRTLAAMTSAMAGVAAERGRKSLVLVSEGFLFDPRLDAYREVVQASLRANTAIHFLDVRALSGTSPVSDVSQRGDRDDSMRIASEESALAAAGAEQVAEDSGGFAIRRGDPSAGMARIAREAEAYYLLGYEPTGGQILNLESREGAWLGIHDSRSDPMFPPARPGSAGLRKVTVRVARDGVTVRARKGYFVDAAGRVAEPGEPPRAGPAKAKPSARREALGPTLVERQDLRLQAAAYVGPPVDRERTKVRLVAEVDLASLGPADGRKGAVPLEVQGDVWPRTGGVWVGLDRRVKLEPTRAADGPAWHALTWDVALPPGVYQARLRLRDLAGGREGTLTHRFEVGPPKGLRFATPIVTDALQHDASGAPSLVAGASRSFDTGTGRSLYVQLELLGAAASRPGPQGVVARVVLRDAAGREVRAVPPAAVTADAGGRLVRAIGFGLDDVGAGTLRAAARGARRAHRRDVRARRGARAEGADG